MSKIRITVVADKEGIKEEREYAFSDIDLGRILWAYDMCFACNGDQKQIVTAMVKRMIATLVDHAHEYERSQPRDPIVPKPE